MGEVNKSNKQGVVMMVGILIALAVFGSFVEVETIANGGFSYLRF